MPDYMQDQWLLIYQSANILQLFAFLISFTENFCDNRLPV